MRQITQFFLEAESPTLNFYVILTLIGTASVFDTLHYTVLVCIDKHYKLKSLNTKQSF